MLQDTPVCTLIFFSVHEVYLLDTQPLPLLSLLPFSSLCSLYLFCLFPTSPLLLPSLFPYLTVSLVVHPEPISRFSSNSWSMQGMNRLRRSVARICRAAISSSLRRWATSWGQLWNRANIPCTMLGAYWFTCRKDRERDCTSSSLQKNTTCKGKN